MAEPRITQEKIDKLLAKHWKRFEDCLECQDDEKFISVMLKLLEYDVPKLQSVAQDITTKDADAAQAFITKMLAKEN